MKMLVRVTVLVAVAAALRVSGANVAPVISLGTNLMVVLPQTATLAALVTDDALPEGSTVRSVWSRVSGPSTITFSNPFATICEATFADPGQYTVRMTAWDGELTNHAECTITVFASPFTLRVHTGGTGAGTITGSGIDTGNDGSATYPRATVVSLKASARAGSTFAGWAGTGYTGTNNPCTVMVDATKDITAFFDAEGTGTTVYYVATNGDNANPGSAALPWRTIQHAVTNAAPGSKVIVKAGEYNEYVINRRSGTAANPIVFEGERGTKGEWLTIIDPSTPITNGWVEAPEIGAGTWKKSGLAFDPKEVTIDNKRVAFVYTMGNLGGYSIYSGVTNGSQLFGMASNALVTMTGDKLRFWDGLEAIYGTSSNSTFTIYLRFRNGDEPNGKNIRASREYDGYRTTDVYWPAVNVNTRSNVVYRNFLIRGAFGCVKLGTDSGAAHHNNVENNHLSGGYTRVFITGAIRGSRSCNNIVRNNYVTSGYYGYNDAGAWGDRTDYHFLIREYLYSFCKYIMGRSSTFDEAIYLYYAGNSNSISGNYLYSGFGGQAIEIWTPVFPPSEGAVVANNTIENFNSVGLAVLSWQTNLTIYGNQFRDCNGSIRLHHMDEPGETNRCVYIYRNTSWLPAQAGEHVFIHFIDDAPATYFPTIWIYNNSYSGGSRGVVWNGFAYQSGGTPNLHIINNIFSGMYAPYGWWPGDFRTNASLVGTYDYNVLMPFTRPAWFGAHNIEQASDVWSNTPVMSFGLTDGSAAVDGALDVTKAFSLRGVSYPALPQTASQKAGNAWDIGASEVATSGAMLPPSDLSVKGPSKDD